jgi:hypothetical protein
MSQEDEIAALVAEVAALRRTIGTLADILVRSGAINSDERRLILGTARRPRDDDGDGDGDGEDDLGEEPPRALVGSPYRGSSPTLGSGCAVCGKALAEDDPELTLGKHGKVCTMCFTRGG